MSGKNGKKIQIVCDESLWKRVKIKAAKEGITIKELVTEILKKAV